MRMTDVRKFFRYKYPIPVLGPLAEFYNVNNFVFELSEKKSRVNDTVIGKVFSYDRKGDVFPYSINDVYIGEELTCSLEFIEYINNTKKIKLEDLV